MFYSIETFLSSYDFKMSTKPCSECGKQLPITYPCNMCPEHPSWTFASTTSLPTATESTPTKDVKEMQPKETIHKSSDVRTGHIQERKTNIVRKQQRRYRPRQSVATPGARESDRKQCSICQLVYATTYPQCPLCSVSKQFNPLDRFPKQLKCKNNKCTFVYTPVSGNSDCPRCTIRRTYGQEGPLATYWKYDHDTETLPVDPIL